MSQKDNLEKNQMFIQSLEEEELELSDEEELSLDDDELEDEELEEDELVFLECLCFLCSCQPGNANGIFILESIFIMSRDGPCIILDGSR